MQVLARPAILDANLGQELATLKASQIAEKNCFKKIEEKRQKVEKASKIVKRP